MGRTVRLFEDVRTSGLENASIQDERAKRRRGYRLNLPRWAQLSEGPQSEFVGRT